MYDYLSIGAGLYGAVFAQQTKAAGKSVLVIDKRNHIGGNVYTEKVDGIEVRLGEYKHYDMDAVIAATLAAAKDVL